jgi:hypothetical protein
MGTPSSKSRMERMENSDLETVIVREMKLMAWSA